MCGRNIASKLFGTPTEDNKQQKVELMEINSK